MAQTIKIKRSSTTVAPSSLASGELAYSTATGVQKLYYGDGTDVLAIGGKSYTDKLDGIEAGANVTDATNVAAAGALMLTGGTLTSDLVLGNNNKVQFGGTTTNLEIYNDGATSYIKENATGNLEIQATDFIIKDGGGQTMMSFDADGVLRLYDQSAANPVEKLKTQATGIYVNGTMNSTGIKLGNETVTIDSIKDEDNMSSDSATALATQQSIKKYVDDSVPTSVATATTATNVNLTNLANDSSDTGPKYLTFSDGNSGSQPLETQDLLYYNPDTAYLTTKNIEVQSGMITGPSVMTIDPNGTGASGELIIQGSLTVKGTTTTIDSNTLSVGDSLIVLNGDENGTPSENAGIEVERGTSGNVSLQWVETGTTSSSYWAVNDASGVSPYYYPILHTRNAHEQTYTIEGGAF
tara:strand:+ start:3474 stop:4706 length:1233 start_codon:yes stop_codon:yes gene_type:complete